MRLGGSVPQSEVLAEMRRSHVLISSSVDFDNQPMVILEAIASGLPVLYADPDLAEVVPDGAGFMAPSPDAAGLASTLTRLLHEPELISSASMAMLAVRVPVTVERIDPGDFTKRAKSASDDATATPWSIASAAS